MNRRQPRAFVMQDRIGKLKLGVAALIGLAGLPGDAGAGPRHRPAAAPATSTQSIPGATITGTNRKIQLEPGLSRMVELSQDAAEVYVGDPKVANALVRSPRKLYVIAASTGSTSIYALDREGRQIASFEIDVSAPPAPPPAGLDQLTETLRIAIPRGRIVVRSVGPALILTGTVPSAGDAQQAVDIANAFVGFIPAGTSKTVADGTTTNGAKSSTTQQSSTTVGPSNVDTQKSSVVNALRIEGKDQVMLKVSIVEVQRSVSKQFGVNTDAAWKQGTAAISNPLSLNGPASVISNTITGSGGQTVTQTLTAFERYGVARVLAEPTVTAVSGESAKFTAGGEIPVPSSQNCTPSTFGIASYCTVGIEFKQYGVTLNFTPVVLSEGRILLRVATEVTEIDPDRTFAFTSIVVPGFRTRKNETSVELPSGGSIVSAGLLQTNARQVIAGLPGAMNLPILGALFRSRDFQRDETELMIVVTPYIAKSLNPDQIHRPDDGFADASDPQSVLLGRVNRLYSSTRNPQALSNFKGKIGFIND